MRVLFNPFFISLLSLGSSIYVLQRLKVPLPVFVQNYANDLLIMPLVLWIVLAVLYVVKGAKAHVSWTMSMSLVMYYSVFFEYYLPRFHARYTADVYDVICYLVGACVFMLFQTEIKRSMTGLSKRKKD